MTDKLKIILILITAVSNTIYNVVIVLPNKFKSNPVNPTHELGFLKPKHKSTMNSVFKSSKSTSERGKLTDCFEFHKQRLP